MEYRHIPVMLTEVLHHLDPKPGECFIDCTLGGAGYTAAIAKLVGKNGKVYSFDLDEKAIENARQVLASQELDNVELINDNFRNLGQVGGQVDGIVFDLGLSSFQLDDEARGFSFKGDRPLNMAFGDKSDNATEEIIRRQPLLELTRIFRDYGEERQAYRIAKAIVAARELKPIKTTAELVSVIEAALPPRYYHRIHPATRIFQALRMATNEELASLEKALPEAISMLKPGGRIVVVSFHSGEDRIVKHFFRSRDDLKILTKRPLVPSDKEAEDNARARSAKLRAAVKIG